MLGGVENKFSLEDTYNLGIVINLTNDTVPLYYNSDGLNDPQVIELAPNAVFVARIEEASAAYCTVDSGTYKFDSYYQNQILDDNNTETADLFSVGGTKYREYSVALIKSKIQTYKLMITIGNNIITGGGKIRNYSLSWRSRW